MSAVPAPTYEPLVLLVQNELAQRAGALSPSSVVVHENREKYSLQHATSNSNKEPERLARVFELMRALNQRAVSDPTIAADDQGSRGFAQTLDGFIGKVCRLLKREPVNYVELGPEPAKTKYVLKRLQAFGIDVHNYIAVDLNPESEDRMRSELAAMLAPEKMKFIQREFGEVNREDLHVDGKKALITMTGFQEGNDHPDINSERFKRMAGTGDVLITEMQVSDEVSRDTLLDFYYSEEMREFSKVSFARLVGDLDSVYRPYTIDLDLGKYGVVPACVTTEHFVEPSTKRNAICVTNWCLKYRAYQLRQHRQEDLGCRVLVEERTGDGSVLFQAAEFT